MLLAALLIGAGAADGDAEKSKYVDLNDENGDISIHVNRGPSSYQTLGRNQQIENIYPYGPYHPQEYPNPNTYQYSQPGGYGGYGCHCEGNPYIYTPTEDSIVSITALLPLGIQTQAARGFLLTVRLQ